MAWGLYMEIMRLWEWRSQFLWRSMHCHVYRCFLLRLVLFGF